MAPKLKSRLLTTQVTLSVLALAGFAIVVVAAFGAFAIRSSDTTALERQQVFVSNGLRDAVSALVREQESVTVWDDSVSFAKAGDMGWVAENLGEWLQSYYGHDRVYVLDAAGRPVYAMRDGKTTGVVAYGDDRPVLEPAVALLRARLGAGESGPVPGQAGFVSLAGQPAILSVMPIVPSSTRLTQAPGSEYLHVSLKYVDGEVAGEIGRQYLLGDIRIVTGLLEPVGAASVPVVASRGEILGYVSWVPDTPGSTLFAQAAPALLAAVFLAGLVLNFLLRRLRRASSQLQISQSEAEHLAFHDTLTGLPNRALFEDRLKRAIVSISRDRGRIALLYVDLDRFKHVNDTLGHPAGDDLVRQAARRLESGVREVDTVARLGGDEFALILSGIYDVRAAEDLAAKLVREIAKPFMLGGDQVFIGASIGIAYTGDTGVDPDDLLRKADIALYEAKKNGRGRYEVFAGDMDDILLRKRTVERDLREALDLGGQFKLDYQPVFAGDGRTIIGAEALVRWEHPIHGALSPSHFVAIAEERGIIGQLGQWIMLEAMRFAAGTDLPWIAVNVSSVQLRDENFVATVLDMLARTGLPASRLQLEITENALIEKGGPADGVLAGLHAAGIRLALDDFGTGYASVNQLRRYPIDKLKIDRSYIRGLANGDGEAAIVKALIDLGHALKVAVTAEGVDGAEQCEMLKAMGCSELQGYLLSPPLPARQMRALVARTPLVAPLAVGG